MVLGKKGRPGNALGIAAAGCRNTQWPILKNLIQKIVSFRDPKWKKQQNSAKVNQKVTDAFFTSLLTFLTTEALENFIDFGKLFGSGLYLFNFRMEFSISDHCVTVGIALSACALFARFSSVAKPDALLRQAFLRSYYTSQSHNGLISFLKSHY